MPPDDRLDALDPDALLRQLRRRLSKRPSGTDPAKRHSAVLVPLVPLDGEIHVLYTRRSQQMNSHPGQISFPGGRIEPSDEDPAAAALRETDEEVGIPPRNVTMGGHLTDYVTYEDDLISAFVGLVEAPRDLHEPTTPEEVEELLLVPLSGLLEGAGMPPATRPPVGLGTLYPIDGYEARRLPDATRDGSVLHYWHLTEATTIWGITGELTARFLRAGFDWEPPSSPEQVEDIGDLQP